MESNLEVVGGHKNQIKLESGDQKVVIKQTLPSEALFYHELFSSEDQGLSGYQRFVPRYLGCDLSIDQLYSFSLEEANSNANKVEVRLQNIFEGLDSNLCSVIDLKLGTDTVTKKASLSEDTLKRRKEKDS